MSIPRIYHLANCLRIESEWIEETGGKFICYSKEMEKMRDFLDIAHDSLGIMNKTENKLNLIKLITTNSTFYKIRDKLYEKHEFREFEDEFERWERKVDKRRIQYTFEDFAIELEKERDFVLYNKPKKE